MKKITAFIFALLFCLMFSVVSFADDIYIVEDGEEDFVPVIPTTTAPAETTTKAGSDSLLGDLGSIEDLLGGFSGMLGDGIDSIFSGLDDLGQLDPNQGSPATTNPSSELPTINKGERPTQSQVAQELTTDADDSGLQQETTPTAKENELPSVLVVNGAGDDNGVLSGSTLTLLVFVGAIVLLIIVGAIVLVMLTRRTEYNSAVMDKSTIPGVEKPRAMSQFTNDNIGEDGNDYGNITYWNDNSGDK